MPPDNVGQQFENIHPNSPLGIAMLTNRVLSNKQEAIHDVTESGATYPRHFHFRADGSTYPSNKGPQGQSMRFGCDGTKCGPYTHKALLNVATDLHRFTSDPEYYANEAGKEHTPAELSNLFTGQGDYAPKDK